MKHFGKKLLAGGVLVAGVCASTAGLAANCPTMPILPSPTASNSVTFGDAIVYALPILGINVQSSPGQIADCIVIMTGPTGGPVTDNGNTSAINNAFQTPNGSPTQPANPYFRTGDPTWSPDPTGGGQFPGDTTQSWDIRLSALASFLTTPTGLADMVVMFNHNQENSGGAVNQDLFIWARVTLHDDAGVLPDLNFYITSTPNSTGLTNFGTPGGNPLAYTGPLNPACPGQTLNTYPTTSDLTGFPQGGIGTGTGNCDANFFVRARGQVCTDVNNIPVPCGSLTAVNTYNDNLGANNVANAAFFPEIQTILNMAGFGGYDVLQADIRMGCNIATLTHPDPTATIQPPCPDGSTLNNGYEQAFIVRGPVGGFVPEPQSLSLLGLGLIVLGAVRMRARKQAN